MEINTIKYVHGNFLFMIALFIVYSPQYFYGQATGLDLHKKYHFFFSSFHTFLFFL